MSLMPPISLRSRNPEKLPRPMSSMPVTTRTRVRATSLGEAEESQRRGIWRNSTDLLREIAMVAAVTLREVVVVVVVIRRRHNIHQSYLEEEEEVGVCHRSAALRESLRRFPTHPEQLRSPYFVERAFQVTSKTSCCQQTTCVRLTISDMKDQGLSLRQEVSTQSSLKDLEYEWCSVEVLSHVLGLTRFGRVFYDEVTSGLESEAVHRGEASQNNDSRESFFPGSFLKEFKI